MAHPDVGGGRSRDELVKAASDSNLVELANGGATVATALQYPVGGFRWRRVGFAIALTAVFVLAYIGWQQTTVIKVTTGLGEQHSEVLPDHSVVELNTQSEIRVGFTAAERRVELVRGEAFFDVSKDSCATVHRRHGPGHGESRRYPLQRIPQRSPAPSSRWPKVACWSVDKQADTGRHRSIPRTGRVLSR